MKYIGPVSFFFEGDKEQALLRQLIARKHIQETIDLFGGIPGTRGIRKEYADGTVIITEVEVGEGWAAPKAVIYVPVRKPKPKPLVIVIPYELYVRESAYVVNHFCVEGRTKVFVAEFSEKGDFLKQYYIGDTLPPEEELTDEEKDEGVFVFSWDNYTKAGPYFVEGTDDLTMGEFATPGATSNCGIKYLPFDFTEKSTPNPGSNNRFNSQIRGSFYSKGKKGESLPTTLSGAVKTAGGLVLIGQLDEGKLSWYKKEDGEWKENELDLGDETLTQLSQAFQFTLDAEGNAIGVGFAGYSSRALYAKARIEVVVDIKGEVTAAAQMLFNDWDSVDASTIETKAVYDTEIKLQQKTTQVVSPKKQEFMQWADIRYNSPAACLGYADASFRVAKAIGFTVDTAFGIKDAEGMSDEFTKITYELIKAELDSSGGLGKGTYGKYCELFNYWANASFSYNFSGYPRLNIVEGWPVLDYSGISVSLNGFDSNLPNPNPEARINIRRPLMSTVTCDLLATVFTSPLAYEVKKKNALDEEGQPLYGITINEYEWYFQASNSAYRCAKDAVGTTSLVHSPEVITTTKVNKEFGFSMPDTLFPVTDLSYGGSTKLIVDYSPWFEMGISFVLQCGLWNGSPRYLGLSIPGRELSHTAVIVTQIESKRKYNPIFGYVGITPIGEQEIKEEGLYSSTTKTTLTASYASAELSPKSADMTLELPCPNFTVVDTELIDDWQSWYVFDADPEYSIAVVSKYIYYRKITDKSIIFYYTDIIAPGAYDCLVDYVKDFPAEESKTITGSVSLFHSGGEAELGHNYYTDFGDFISGKYGPMVRPPYAPFSSFSLNTPLNSVKAIAPYGSTIVTQFFGVDHYALVGICDGRIYSQPSKKLDLALASGGWWMRDAGANGPNESYGNDVLSNKKPELASKIKAWFDTKYPSNSEQDYRFLGLSFYRPK